MRVRADAAMGHGGAHLPRPWAERIATSNVEPAPSSC